MVQSLAVGVVGRVGVVSLPRCKLGRLDWGLGAAPAAILCLGILVLPLVFTLLFSTLPHPA